MNRKLLFYNKDQFPHYKKIMSDDGSTISSFTHWCYLNPNEIEEKYSGEVIDISSMVFTTRDNNFQFQVERIINSFWNDTIFIVDKKYEEIVKHELRFCFDEFEDIAVDISDETVEGKKKLNVIEINGRTVLEKRKVIDLDKVELNDFFIEFNDGLYGHQKFKDEFRKLIETYRVFNALGEHKVLSLFLMGDSGVGKTEVARVIQKCLKGKTKLAKINFGNYSSKDALNSLIGSPRGYMGSETGELFEKVYNSDVGLILIDEFEKADSLVYNYFLDVLENGKMTNSLGEEIDVNGYIIVFTSNISREGFKERISPELRSRFNLKVHFSLLFNRDKEKFVQFRLKEILYKFKKKFDVDISQNVYDDLTRTIKVSEFKNMRDLNKCIKDVFVDYVKNHLVNEEAISQLEY